MTAHVWSMERVTRIGGTAAGINITASLVAAVARISLRRHCLKKKL